MWKRVAAVLAATELILTSVAAAQQHIAIGSELEDYVRLLQLDGSVEFTPFAIRALSASAPAAVGTASAPPWGSRYALQGSRGVPEHEWGLHTSWVTPDARLVLNTAYARGANDGSMWAGKGATIGLSGGMRVEVGPFIATLAPAVYHVRNAAFPIVPITDSALSPYAYPWHRGNIDWPQRFGADPYTTFDWGQSGIRMDLGGFSAGFSTENLWWGPGQRNAIVMSNAAAGFPHVDLGTDRPMWIGIGRVELRAVFGRLAESPYYDTIPTNDARFFTGIVGSYQPRWLPGLVVGATRVLYRTWPADGLDAGDLVAVFSTIFKESARLPNGALFQDSTDQLVSLFARWVFPESGFETYVEWARNDFSGNLRDFLQEPDHSQAYTFGFQKTLSGGGSMVRLRGEWTHLGTSRTSQVRATPTYYVHNIARGGYTHRGQLLGAWIGPGSDSQYFGVDRYDHRGRLGGFIQRVRFDDDAYYTNFGDILTRNGHDVELSAGVSALVFAGDFDVSAGITVSRELNRYFIVRPERNEVTNINVQVGLNWNMQ